MEANVRLLYRSVAIASAVLCSTLGLGMVAESGTASAVPSSSGYWLGAADGGVFSFGAPFYGSGVSGTGGSPGPCGFTPQPPSTLNASNGCTSFAGNNAAYWLLNTYRWVAGFGAGSTTPTSCTQPISSGGQGWAAIGTTSDGNGLWLVTANGTVGTCGDATSHGDLGGTTLNAPIVGIASTSDNGGYWLVAADGGVFSFGDAQFHGSMGGQSLNAPVVGMTPEHGGLGYWLVAADGGVFSFGDAQFHGSMAGQPLNAPAVGIATNNVSGGYWIAAADGGVFTFGNLPFLGSMAGQPLNGPVVGIASYTRLTCSASPNC
jgi:hypothetical protein